MFTVINVDFGVNADFDSLPEAIDHILYLCPTGHYFINLDNKSFCKIENYTDYEYDMILFHNPANSNFPVRYFKLRNIDLSGN